MDEREKSSSPETLPSNDSSLSDEFRLVFLRASYFSILVAEIFAIIQIHAMLNNSIKASQTDIWHGIILISILPAVFIHLFASAFIPVDSFAVWVDLALLISEFSFIIWILTQGYAVINPLSDRTSPFLVLASYALLLCLFALIILRIVDKVRKVTPANSNPQQGFWYRVRGVLSGRRIWEPHYTGERSWMIWCRAALTLSFLILFPFYVTWSVVVQPLQGAAFMTVTESLSRALPPDFKDIKDAHWNVVITNFPQRRRRPSRSKSNSAERRRNRIDHAMRAAALLSALR
jgi:hypothetical protein